jgi:hypothetical protein
MLTSRRRLLLAAVPLTLALGACSGFNDDRGLGDAPAAQVDDAAVPVWPGPDGFMNIGAYCIGENGVYIHTRVAAPVVVRDDPNCEPGGVLAGVRPASAGDVENAPVVDEGEDSDE